MKYRLALSPKSMWLVRVTVPPISSLLAGFAGWMIREDALGVAFLLFGIVAVAQLVLAFVQASEQAEPPTDLREVGAVAGKIMGKAAAMKAARRDDTREGYRRDARQEGLDALRTQLAPKEEREAVRASFYRYDEANDAFTLVRSSGRVADPAPTNLPGAALDAAKEVMHRHTTTYMRKKFWARNTLCEHMRVKVLAIGSAVQYQGGRGASVGVVIVDAATRKHISKPRALGWVSAIAVLLAADPIHEKVVLP